jgi:copper chaperone CopZ
MCKKNIEAALRFEPGVKRAVLDLETKKLMVIYQSGKTNPEKLRLAVSKSGYDADQIPADSSAYRKLEPCCQKGGH